jgi:hypothetical protein
VGMACGGYGMREIEGREKKGWVETDAWARVAVLHAIAVSGVPARVPMRRDVRGALDTVSGAPDKNILLGS